MCARPSAHRAQRAPEHYVENVTESKLRRAVLTPLMHSSSVRTGCAPALRPRCGVSLPIAIATLELPRAVIHQMAAVAREDAGVVDPMGRELKVAGIEPKVLCNRPRIA
eukprot:2526903-Prymnesium_polylepis.1